ncbi:portal protein [Staphylococcus phage Twort]|uniref:Portal protein n=1 Tax=Staphylococcus phage Twort (strain DSM 17442 / HER 48) TaxID=2908167 RepID=A0A6H0X5B4_BPTWO|nr:portal protein [Staphylococcus phage Twort]
MADIFKRLRLGRDYEDIIDTVPIDDGLQANIRNIEEKSKELNKSLYGKQQAYAEPFLEVMDTNPEFRTKRSYMKNSDNLHDVLKQFGNNPILNAIILTRSNQVAMYCQPSRYNERGLGFEVRMRDLDAEPGKKEKEEIKRIENFILNTGRDKDIDRDSFQSFCRKIVRDTYTYDQVNFEKVFNKKNATTMDKFIAVDPSTIFYATDKNGKIIKGGKRFVQVINKKVVASFTSREMAMGIRNPRTELSSSGYGLSEVEIAMKQFIAYNNTETFNDRFFSHGGTTRGILQIKSEQQQSQRALENFKREWKSSFSGINGSWQVPVVMADDIKFVNMTPTANDMQFEKWLTYLINIISALYGIDPAEIGFPNRGGATGGKGGNTLNEADPGKKQQQSQNKGLQPLLRFIEDLINTHIISEYSDKYVFQFVGGDTKSELDKIKILQEEVKTYKTVNEARKEKGLKPIEGGDVLLDGSFIQSMSLNTQKEQYEDTKQKERFDMIQQFLNSPDDEEPQQESTEDKVDGRESNDPTKIDSPVGTDGQLKDQDNVKSQEGSNKGQGTKGKGNEKPSDFKNN